MLFWKKFMNWLNAPSTGPINAQTTGMVGLATMTTPAATVAIVQATYATPPVETKAEEPDVAPTKVKKARSKSTEPRTKKPRASRKPKIDTSNPN